MSEPVQNTDRELFRERLDDYYAPSVFVTEGGAIGMNVGGNVVVRTIREWHQLAWKSQPPQSTCSDLGICDIAECQQSACVEWPLLGRRLCRDHYIPKHAPSGAFDPPDDFDIPDY